jgi:transposase, IS5 family
MLLTRSQAAEPVRAVNRDYSQGQGGQAQRIWQDGQAAGSRKPDRDRLRGLRDRRPHDSDLLIPAIEAHRARLGRTPRLVAADAAFYSATNEAAAKAKGVKRLCVSKRPTAPQRSQERKREQRKRWFRNGQKWRTGCEGRISVAKRRHGLNRCRYKGETGMKRWVGLGVIADNLINIGRAVEQRSIQ